MSEVIIDEKYWLKYFKDLRSGHCNDNGFLMTPTSFQFANYFMNGYPVYSYSKIRVEGGDIREDLRYVWRDKNYWYMGKEGYKYLFWFFYSYSIRFDIKSFKGAEGYDYVEYLPPIKDGALISNFNHFLKLEIEKANNTL